MDEDITNINRLRLRSFLRQRIPETCAEFIYDSETREKVKAIVENMLSQIVAMEVYSEFRIEVTEDEIGDVLAVIHGPRELIGSSIGNCLATRTGIRNPLFVRVKGRRRWLADKPSMESDQECVVTIEDKNDAKVLRMVTGGVTGYEGFYIDDLINAQGIPSSFFGGRIAGGNVDAVFDNYLAIREAYGAELDRMAAIASTSAAVAGAIATLTAQLLAAGITGFLLTGGTVAEV
ncbi:MAG: hypothetical protein IIA14_13960, partial [SAR324 cluster bacterium]|nr:hypothetical protein [SAR324 cluster bacterium]